MRVRKPKPTLDITCINCASTKGGDVARLLAEVCEASRVVAEAEKFRPVLRTLHLCDLVKRFRVPQENFVPKYIRPVVEKLIKTDVILFASPVRWWMPSALFQQFLADITALEHDWDFKLKGKVVGVVTNFDEDGGMKVALDIAGPMNHFGCVFAPHALYYRDRTGAKESEAQWQLHDHTHVMTHNAVLMGAVLKKAAPQWS